MTFIVDADGYVEDVRLPSENAREPWAQDMIDCYKEVLAGEPFPCLEGENVVEIYPPIVLE